MLLFGSEAFSSHKNHSKCQIKQKIYSRSLALLSAAVMNQIVITSLPVKTKKSSQNKKQVHRNSLKACLQFQTFTYKVSSYIQVCSTVYFNENKLDFNSAHISQIGDGQKVQINNIQYNKK